MADQAALQEAIQRARQLAAKITQNQPVKRPTSTNELSGPVKVTLAYEKPTNPVGNDDRGGRSSYHDSSSRQRSSSRDYNRNERESSYSRESRPDLRDSRDYRDNNHNRESRESQRNYLPGGIISNMLNNNISSQTNNQYESSAQPQSQASSRSAGTGGGGGEDKIEIIIPHAVIGLVIGKGGENIKRIQNESGAIVRVDPTTVDERGNKLCTITGTKDAVEEARLQVESVIESAGTSKRPRMQPSDGSDSFRLKIPASRTGAIIGKGGETIKSIKQQSGCDIELDKSAKECGPEESLFIIRGSPEKIMKARNLIETRLAQGSRDRDRDRDRGERSGGGGGGGGGGIRDHHNDHHSGRSGGKGVATGANAAPVGQFSDIPAATAAATYPAAVPGQQNSADMTAAWAAYFAQYSTLFNQTGVQSGATGMPYASQQSSMLGTTSVTTPATSSMVGGQSIGQLDPQAQQASLGDAGAATGGTASQDFSDQWIEYYMANGRPDYAEQIIQMKKQQQGQK